MELSIRKQLTAAGFYGSSAKLARVKLIAVQRPGWVQVYQFEFSAKRVSANDAAASTTNWSSGYGLVLEDARKNQSDVKLFDSYGKWFAAAQSAKNR